MFKIQILNNIAQQGLEQFDNKHYELNAEPKNPDAILCRSYNLHDMAIEDSVKIIARAGAGTNNIPLDKMTQLGIPVLNTPGANANAVKELVITGLLLACRNICTAWDYARNVEGDAKTVATEVEKNKKNFSGYELPGKTLGIIGLGNIGVKVANAARYLGMNVIGYDPAITVKSAWELRSSVKQAEQLQQVLRDSDFISLHVPLNKHTKNLIDKNAINGMKDNAVLLNFARDGIIDQRALLAALQSGKIHRYVCDFPHPDFKNNEKVICLPHLGASTKEAEENCAVMAAQQIKCFLETGEIKHSVNFPNVKLAKTDGHRLSIVNANVPNMVAQISSVLSENNLNIIDMINKSRDNIAYTLVDVNTKPPSDTLKKLSAIEGVVKV
nr:phosphoglycerate dehydrogenase [Gammaproteobacteria bacterium]